MINKRLVPIILFLITIFSGNGISADSLKPCNQPENRQFDFWIGDWVVKDKAGKVVGYNKIFPILNGCALSENWQYVKGNPGVSYNFDDKTKAQWHQTWIDSSGGSLYLDGKLIDGKMVLTGQKESTKNANIWQKISWSTMKNGVIKQHWQSSKDDKKSWQDVFVGYYHPAN